MAQVSWPTTIAVGLLIGALVPMTAQAQSVDLGEGFIDHGPAGAANSNRGMACTVDGEGNEVVLVWLFDRRYSYALAVIDAQTGEVGEIPRPIDHDCPFSSMLASNGRYYTYFGGHFMEFDPVRREFTFVQESAPRMAMSMTEDDAGRIWAATNPDCTVVRYDPATGDFRDFGAVHDENWDQFPSTIAVDDQGWVYIGNGPGAEQIVVFDPETGRSFAVLTEDDERTRGHARVWRYEDGKVYGTTRGGQWYELHGGEVNARDGHPEVPRRRYASDSFILQHRDLPGGERVVEVDLWDNRDCRLVIENPETGDTRELRFEVSGGGGHPMSVATAPDGTIIGSTYIPQQVFNYDPRTDDFVRREPFTQWNALDSDDDLLYVGGYGYGVMLEWDPARDWVNTDRENPESNPRYLVNTIDLESRHINRPADILVHPDGIHVILSGIPYRGHTGGGLTIWNRETEAAEVLTDRDLVEDQSTTTMLALSDGRVLCGTTVTPSLGGERIADEAEMYLLNLADRTVEWRAPVLPGAVRYTDTIITPEGNVLGVVDRRRVFLFDPDERAIIHSRYLDEEEFGATVGQQAERALVQADDGRIFLLLNSGIAEVDPQTCEVSMLARSPERIGTGGAFLDGRVYFGTGTNLMSWQVPPAE